MNPTSEEEFQSQYGIEPTVLQNLKASQEQLAKKGISMSLEEVYEFEIGPLPETKDEQAAASEKTSHALQMEQVAQSLLRDGLASTIEEARQMVDEAI